MRPSLKRVVPGSVPPWRAPCFAWPCRGFGLPGVFSWLCRGFLLPAARNRGAASEVASRSAIARSFPFCSSRSTFEAVKTRSSGRRRSPAARGLSSMFKSLGLSARLRAGPTFGLCFSSGEELRDGSLAACFPPPTRTAAAARNLLLSPCVVVLAAWLPPRAPKFGFLTCADNLLRLALGNGIWLGGIEIEALDDLRFEKSNVLKS